MIKCSFTDLKPPKKNPLIQAINKKAGIKNLEKLYDETNEEDLTKHRKDIQSISTYLKKKNSPISKTPRSYLAEEFESIYKNIDIEHLSKANAHKKITEIKIRKYQAFSKFISNIQTFSETNKPAELHKNLKTILRLKNPSPIMQDLIDPETDEIANDKTKETLIE